MGSLSKIEVKAGSCDVCGKRHVGQIDDSPTDIPSGLSIVSVRTSDSVSVVQVLVCETQKCWNGARRYVSERVDKQLTQKQLKEDIRNAGGFKVSGVEK